MATTLLSVRDVATQLRCSRQYIHTLVRDGKLDALRIGDGERAPIRIEAADLNAFLERANQRRAPR